MISKQETQVIGRCKKSVAFFLRNFGMTKHPKAGIIPFNPFKYQKKAIGTFKHHRFSIFRKCRQSGASKICGAFALWFALFHNFKTILIVSRTDEDAKTFLAENVTFLFKHLPAWMQELWTPVKDNEHELHLPNGSKIRSLTSHPDVLRSNASSLNIIDEAAFINDMSTMWAGGFSTLQHGGCLHKDSLIFDTTGLRPVSSYHAGSSAWVDCHSTVETDNGAQKVVKGYKNGVAKTRRITTADGHYVEATLEHRFRVLADGDYVWRSVRDLLIGDEIVLSARPVDIGSVVQLDRDIFNQSSTGCRLCGDLYSADDLKKLASKDDGWCSGCLTKTRMLSNRILSLPCLLDTRLAEFIGIYVGDGFYDKQGRFGISCDRKYPDYIGWLHKCIQNLFSVQTRDEVNDDDWSIRFNHSALALLFRKNGIDKQDSTKAYVPDVIMRADSDCRHAFLRGLFEADGSINECYITLSSSSIVLTRQVQTLLLASGMRSKLSVGKRKNGFSENPKYTVRLKTRRDVISFRKKIGFISAKKCKRLDAVKGSLRSHNDYYDCPGAIDEFYQSSIGLPSSIRQSILHRAKKGRLARWFAREVANTYPSLASTTIGKLALADLFVDRIANLEDSECDTFDITVEPDHCYLANGFISHNSVIVISTTNGMGDWYWGTWTDAEAGLNDFHPIMINWWDMDWEITFRDDLSGEMTTIAPTKGIRKCTTPEDIDKYGPFWSPWLEEQYRGLQERGEAWKFKQEILAEFVGSGNTVLDGRVLAYMTTTIEDDFDKINGEQPYIHPVTGEHSTINFNSDGIRRLDKDEGVWVWKKPNFGRRPEMRGNKIVDPGEPPHCYVAGIDIATGKGRDYFGMEIFDITEMEQVAEVMIRTIPRIFKYIADYVGRWYNNSLLVIERNNGGDSFIDDLRMEFMYPNIWRKKTMNDKPTITKRRNPMKVAEYGFFTSGAGKPRLNKALIDNLRADENGFTIYSRRLVKQCNIYVRKKDRTGRDTDKTEAEDGPGNYDDLVISSGLAFIGAPDAAQLSGAAILPHKESSELNFKPFFTGPADDAQQIVVAGSYADPGVLVPIISHPEIGRDESIAAEIARFSAQLGAMPIAQNIPSVSAKRHQIGKGRK